jgi:hypothetical protein
MRLDVDLLGDLTVGQKTDELFYLTRESMKRGQMDELWQARRATAPKSLAQVLLTDAVTEAVRKELRRKPGQRVERAKVSRLLRETVIHPDCFD